MAIAKILVPVTGAARDVIALATAFAAAKPFGAHVAALFVHADPREGLSYVYSGAPVSPDIIQSIIDAQVKLSAEAENAAKATLNSAAKDSGAVVLAVAEKRDMVSASLGRKIGYVAHSIAEAARFADAVVFGPITVEDGPELMTAFLDTLTHSGRPVILSAQKPPMSLGHRVAIAWDGSNSAARAVTAALPYLKRASQVQILVVGHNSAGHLTVPALRELVAMHGVSATERVIEAGPVSVGEMLTEAASAAGADLLVMGGYGHSHLREMVLGGATRQVISHLTVPVLMVH